MQLLISWGLRRRCDFFFSCGAAALNGWDSCGSLGRICGAALAVSGLVCLSVLRKGREFGLFFRGGDFLKCGGHLGDLGELGDVAHNFPVAVAA